MIRPVTQSCFDAMMFDAPISAAEMVDFGIDSVDHHRALQAAARNATVEELDEVLGDGPAITAFVAKHAAQYAGMTFKTAYDDMGPPE
ncbi:hypothetical protein CMI47_10100 [Candidatus Pacearchaeota archaeon]|jgi:hypothetical protein|nr:hypothetical protein [Candidatus Pacearchaeota archaeon]|tara:strand:- start:1705 stop:1968 length:264 start_codon:yes stop_codon:yes gene_type:complete